MPSPAVFSGSVWFFINKLLKEFKLTGKCCRAASHLHHLGAEWSFIWIGSEKSNSFPSDMYMNNVTPYIALCSVLRGFSRHIASHFTGQKIQIRSAHVLLCYICTFSLNVFDALMVKAHAFIVFTATAPFTSAVQVQKAGPEVAPR